MPQRLRPQPAAALQATPSLADILEQEHQLCVQVTELLVAQREALLGRDETAVWRTSEEIVAAMDRLQAAETLRRQAESRGDPEASDLRHRLRHAYERLRLEGLVNQEIVADMLALVDFRLRQVLPQADTSYDPQGRPCLESALGPQLDQEA